MGSLSDILRAIHIAKIYGKDCTFVYDGEAYITVAQVEGDAQNEFVCIRTTHEGGMLSLGVVTINPELGYLNFQLIRSNDTRLKLEAGATIEMMSLVVMSLTAFRRVDHQFESSEDAMQAIVELTRQVFYVVLAAGLLDSHQSYFQLMEFGKNSRQPWWLRWRHEPRHYEQLRRQCRPGQPAAWENYLVTLVSAKAIELLQDEMIAEELRGLAAP